MCPFSTRSKGQQDGVRLLLPAGSFDYCVYIEYHYYIFVVCMVFCAGAVYQLFFFRCKQEINDGTIAVTALAGNDHDGHVAAVNIAANAAAGFCQGRFKGRFDGVQRIVGSLVYTHETGQGVGKRQCRITVFQKDDAVGGCFSCSRCKIGFIMIYCAVVSIVETWSGNYHFQDSLDAPVQFFFAQAAVCHECCYGIALGSKCRRKQVAAGGNLTCRYRIGGETAYHDAVVLPLIPQQALKQILV